MPAQLQKPLHLISNNEAKLIEFRKLMPAFHLDMLKVQLPDIQHHNMESLAAHKLEQATSIGIGAPFFVEHTGLAIQAWSELPGGLTGQFMDNFGCDGLCKILKNYEPSGRVAVARTVIGYFDGSTIRCFHGSVSGTISDRPRGNAEFGWDPIFIPAGHKTTYAEMTPEEKNSISMRRKAALEFSEYLTLCPGPLAAEETLTTAGEIDRSAFTWDFFLAHAGTEKASAEELYDLLAPHARVFLDSRSIRLGDDWDQALPREQAASAVTVVLISANTDQAYFQRDEIAAAIAMARKDSQRHRVVPVYLAGADPETVPYGLRIKHGIPSDCDLPTVADCLLELLRH